MKLGRPIAFLPGLAIELGGIEEAIFYQQIHYWSDKGSRDDGFIYKSISEIQEETTLTRRQQDRIRKKLINNGWIEVKKTHAPNGAPTLHYRCLIEISICTKGTNGYVRNVQNHLHETYKSSYTENTTEITTNSTASGAGSEVQNIIPLFETVNPSWKRIFSNKTQRSALERLFKELGREKLENVIKFLPTSNASKFAPTITTPVQLENELGRLIAWGQKQKSSIKSKGKEMIV